MFKPFYIEVKDPAAGDALAAHLEKHNGLKFVTEEAVEGTLDELVLLRYAVSLPVRRYGEVITKHMRPRLVCPWCGVCVDFCYKQTGPDGGVIFCICCRKGFDITLIIDPLAEVSDASTSA